MTHYANASNARIAYSIDGPAGAPVVMFANSLGADRSMWDANVAAFAASHRVLRYDMRGHGRSDAPAGDYTLDELTRDAIAVLDHAAIERVHFVGISLGGIIGQRLGALHGSRVISLALCDCMSKQGAPQVWKDRVVAVRAEGLEPVVEGTIARWFTPAFVQAQPALMDRIRAMIRGTSVNGYSGCAAAVSQLDQTGLLARIKAPVLVLTGREDSAAPPEAAADMHARIAGSELRIIDDAAHLPNIERTQAFDGAVLAFMARTAAP